MSLLWQLKADVPFSLNRHLKIWFLKFSLVAETLELGLAVPRVSPDDDPADVTRGWQHPASRTVAEFSHRAIRPALHAPGLAMVDSLAGTAVSGIVITRQHERRIEVIAEPVPAHRASQAGGGVRGRATGDTFRRLVCSLAGMFADTFDEATRPYQARTHFQACFAPCHWTAAAPMTRSRALRFCASCTPSPRHSSHSCTSGMDNSPHTSGRTPTSNGVPFIRAEGATRDALAPALYALGQRPRCCRRTAAARRVFRGLPRRRRPIVTTPIRARGA